jgi:hypothetical protein
MIGALIGFSHMFLLGILIFKGLTVRRLYKSFGVKRVNFISTVYFNTQTVLGI